MINTKPKMGRGAAKTKKRQVADIATLPLFASAMKKRAPALDRVAEAERPDVLSSGLESLDQALRGGFPLGRATLVAGRPKVGVTSLLLGTCLTALKQGHPVAYFSESLREEQIRGRFVVLESRVNGYRFKAGFVTAEDRIALAAARERIPWSQLSIVSRRHITMKELDGHLFSYRPMLVVADILPRGSSGVTTRKATAVLSCVQGLANLAVQHNVAVLVRAILPRAEHPPNRLELPGVGSMAEAFSAALLMHREEVTDPAGIPEEAAGQVEIQVIRVRGHDVEPRTVDLQFDQRFAGLVERS